jgi:hypothetical protein
LGVLGETLNMREKREERRRDGEREKERERGMRKGGSEKEDSKV